jgi:hypothetical protein
MGADVNVHLTYTKRYNDMAHEFVMKKLMENGMSMPNMGKGVNGASSTGASVLGIGLAFLLGMFVLGS